MTTRRSRWAGVRLALAALAAIVALVLAPGVPSAGAQAIEGAITSVEVVPADPLPGQNVELKLTWAVPDDARAGDTFSMDLPGELNRITTSFALTNSTGDVVANAVVSAGGVTVTLTDFVTTHTNVRGTAFFWAQLDWDVVTGEPITLDFGSVTTVITPRPSGSGGGYPGTIDRTKPTKGGFWRDLESGDYGAEGDHLEYVVQSPAGPFQEVRIVDSLGPGQEYVCSGTWAPKVNLYAIHPDTGAYMQGQGAVVAPNPADLSLECSSTALRVTVTNVGENLLVGLTYRVQVTDPSLKSYSNTAWVTADNQTEDTKTTIVRTGAGGSGTGEQPDPKPTVAVAKSADPPSGTVLTAGQTVTYTLAFDHSGTGSADVDYTDHLGDVLDDASFGRVVDDGGLSVTGPQDDRLRITGSITGDTSVVYTVVVTEKAGGDGVLHNVVGAGIEPPGTGDPFTKHSVRYLYVEKVGDGGAGRLDGAEFVLRADDDGKPGGVLTTPSLTAVETGLFVTDGIDPGAYWLDETKAPEGFQLLAAPVRFTVADDGTVTLSDPSAHGALVRVSAADDGTSTITVADRRAFDLPLTGGPGALAFWISGGVLLMAAAGYLVVARRSASSSPDGPEEAGM